MNASGTPTSRLPSLTIVLPAYNEEALIGRTLDKVTDYLGTIEDEYSWEILAVNDGSRDGTGKILDEYTATNHRIRVLHHHRNSMGY